MISDHYTSHSALLFIRRLVRTVGTSACIIACTDPVNLPLSLFSGLKYTAVDELEVFPISYDRLTCRLPVTFRESLGLEACLALSPLFSVQFHAILYSDAAP